MRNMTFLITTHLFFLFMGMPHTHKMLPAPTIAKWFNNYPAAISLTYDDGRPGSKLNETVNKFIIENGLTMDYEIITSEYAKKPKLRYKLLEELIPAGIGYFGHGHKHVNHDRLSYDEALSSFKECCRVLKGFGLQPVAYAYPLGAGLLPKTRKALSEAGFLSGRLHFSEKMNSPYILPGSALEPDDWFALPTLSMQDSINRCKHCISNNEQLIPYLEQAIKEKAWIILTYHAIGNKKNYGYYRYEEFQKNILAVKERNLWNASMNAVTLYIRERRCADVILIPFMKKGRIEKMSITVSDNLPNAIYNQPLTVLFQIPDEWVNQPISLHENGKTIKTFIFPSVNVMISLVPDEIEREFFCLSPLNR